MPCGVSLPLPLQLKEKLCLESSAGRDRAHLILGSSSLTEPSSLTLAVDSLVEMILTQKPLQQ